MSAASGDLRRRYRRLLAVYPSNWRAANETVVLDTLLEATGPGERRWPPPREALALLAGGVRAWIVRLRPDPDQRRLHWLEGVHLGAVLLAAGWLLGSGGQLLNWGIGREGWGQDMPGYGQFSAVVAVVAAVVLVLVLRGRVRAALATVGVPAALAVVWGIAAGFRIETYFWKWGGLKFPEGVFPGSLTFAAGSVLWPTVLQTLPLLAILAVLAWHGGARAHSSKWLLVLPALAVGWAGGTASVVLLALWLVALLAALVLAATAGEVRPAVALTVAVGLPWALSFALARLVERPLASGMEASSLAMTLALAALALWCARRARQGHGASHGNDPQPTAVGPAPHNGP